MLLLESIAFVCIFLRVLFVCLHSYHSHPNTMSGNGISGEGASSTRPPLLTGVNYSTWKGKMEAYVCQIHDRAWMAIEDGYTAPMMTLTGGGEEVPKPKAQWSPQEFEASKWNHKAMHAILYAMDDNQ